MNKQSTILLYDDREGLGNALIELVNLASEWKWMYLKPEKTREWLSPSFQETVESIQWSVKVLIDTSYLTSIANEIESKWVENIREWLKDVNLYVLSWSEEYLASENPRIFDTLEYIRNILWINLIWMLKPLSIDEVEALLDNKM